MGHSLFDSWSRSLFPKIRFLDHQNQNCPGPGFIENRNSRPSGSRISSHTKRNQQRAMVPHLQWLRCFNFWVSTGEPGVSSNRKGEWQNRLLRNRFYKTWNQRVNINNRSSMLLISILESFQMQKIKTQGFRCLHSKCMLFRISVDAANFYLTWTQ